MSVDKIFLLIVNSRRKYFWKFKPMGHLWLKLMVCIVEFWATLVFTYIYFNLYICLTYKISEWCHYSRLVFVTQYIIIHCWQLLQRISCLNYMYCAQLFVTWPNRSCDTFIFLDNILQYLSTDCTIMQYCYTYLKNIGKNFGRSIFYVYVKKYTTQ